MLKSHRDDGCRERSVYRALRLLLDQSQWIYQSLKRSGWNICASYGGKTAAEMSKLGLTQEHRKISCKSRDFLLGVYWDTFTTMWVVLSGVCAAASMGLSGCPDPRGGCCRAPGCRGTGGPHPAGASLLLPQRRKHLTKKLVFITSLLPVRVTL